MKIRSRRRSATTNAARGARGSGALSARAKAKKAKTPNPLRIDPTRTVTLRRQFAARLKRAFARLRLAIWDKLIKEDHFGLAHNRLTINAPYQFATDPQKVKDFEEWLREQYDTLLTGKSEEALWSEYIQAGYKKGAGRSFDDVRAAGRTLLDATDRTDFYDGTKDEFLRDSFAQPVARERVEKIAERSFEYLEDMTDEMAEDMKQTLTDGLVEGQSPREIARDLDKDLEIGGNRALTIARTEVIRAHAEGQLDAMDKMGVEEVGVAVEWSTTGDDKVCEECEPLEGVVLTLDEARGMLPRHPNCRCAWIPANVGEDDEDQKRGKEEIEEAFDGDLEVDEDRPESILGNGRSASITNVFCATGHGGGIDPNCSPGGAAGLGSTQSLLNYIKGTAHGLKPRQLLEIEALNPQGLTSGGIKVHDTIKPHQLDHLKSILPAGTLIRGVTSAATKKAIDALQSGIGTQTPAPATPSAFAHLPHVPFQPETKWETGKAQPAQLNGVPFASAPPKFWEHAKDQDIKEPPPLHPIVRVSVMVKEPDGRVWIAHPTNGFGERKATMPGGTIEKGLSLQQNALKETWEETGLQVKITGHLGDFQDSNYAKSGSPRWGRLYMGERIGGAPWDAKIEPHIIDHKTGKPSAESDSVTLATPEAAAKILHRTDDLAQLATVAPIPLKTKVDGNVIKNIVDGVQPQAKAYRDKSANGVSELHAVQELRGFNGKPKLVSKADMDKLVASGTHIELLRGIKDAGRVTADKMAEQFKTGDHFPGYGCFGAGTYADSNKGYNNVAAPGGGYAGDATLRMALPKTAKIIKQSELEKIVDPSTAPAKFASNHSGQHTPGRNWQGVHAALAGYDAIHVDGASTRQGSYGMGFYVVLNRSILTVQSDNARGHVIK